MSGHEAAAPKGLVTRLIQAGALVVVGGLLFGATRAAPELEARLGTVAAVGFLLLAGTLMSELFETLGLPHLSGYLVAGILGGPHVLHLVDHDTVTELSPVNTLALALIAIAGGAEMDLRTLRTVARSVSRALLLQCTLGLVAMTGVFLVLSRYVPFTSGMAPAALFGVALLWGTLAVSRSPSALLGILAQTRAKGPLATFSLAFVMASDVVVAVMMAISMMLARPLVTPAGSISFDDFNVLGHELAGSVSVGATLGVLLIAYLKLVGRNLLLILIALGFGMSDFMRYVHIDPLLSFITAGFVVRNLSEEGDQLLEAVEQIGAIVFVVFFATAGAHLDVPLLKKLWPIALALSATRATVTFGLAKLSSKLCNDPPTLRRWSWSSLISQAGLTLGLSVVVERQFPDFGPGFRSLAIAVVAINEMVGPVLFKLGLDRAGETDNHAQSRSSLAPPTS